MPKQPSRFARPRADPFWYKDALIYEVHVRAFLDSNGDGIGDFPGLTQKLDYIQDLGVTAIWLLPFYPSPLKDDGYDIADYFSINPIYGTLKDFNSFLQEAHQRNLRVITELVVNHTSDAHPWFQASRRAKPGSSARNYYVWSDTPDKYREARIIFRDFEPSNWTWDPVANSYFWHRFYSHQPDLNYDNPQVHKEIIRALDFWLDLGVDGLRLDAVPYLYEREGTSCENLKETHDYLKTLRRHIDTKYGDRMLLAEANQWPEEAVTYFGQGRGDECHMAFHFPLMPRIFMSVRMEDRVPIVDILDQTPAIPETSQWALFLRNHDELTLEMVTDEERDYMYRVYANDARARINLGIRRRLAPLLGNSRRRIELLYMLLLSLPGTPVLYYGDELGMGDNVFLGDRNGVRTPMHWNSDRNAGFSRASPQALYLPIILDPEYHYEAINAEAQRANPNSLWWWMKRVLTLRQRYQAFGRGKLEFLKPENRKILAFTRTYEDQTLLVVANLSRFTQPVRLDLAQFNHSIPVELFGQTEFPAISESPYFLTLAPHAAFWFALESVAEGEPLEVNHPMGHVLSVTGPWESILENEQAALLRPRLLGYLRSRRWFGQKSREVTFAQIQEVIPVPFEMSKAYLLLLQIEYTEGDPSEYILPVAFAATALAQKIESDSPRSIICRLRLETKNEEGVLYEAFASREFCRVLFDGISRRRSFSGLYGELKAIPAAALKSASSGNGNTSPEPELLPADQSNTSIVFGQKYFLKLFRRVENGTNPDLEIGRFLTERNFANIPRLAGSLEYRGANGKNFTVGMMTQFLPEAKNAWEYALETLSRYFDRVRTASPALLEAGANQGMFALAQVEPPEAAVAMVGTSLETARLLGQRTGELHLELAADRDNKDFAPEPFTPFYQRSLYQSMRNQTMNTLQLLRQSIARLPSEIRQKAEEVANRENEIISCFQVVCERPISGQRIRCHGDFHLGQILYTGKDFMVIDFEGEPARPLGERRIKRTPLRDVAAMLRSFDYITHAALFKQIELGGLLQEHLPQVEPWTGFWYRWVSAVFLKSYLSVLGETDLLPKSNRNLTVLLNAQLLEKALYEISYELNNRPDWVKIPLHGILRLLDSILLQNRDRAPLSRPVLRHDEKRNSKCRDELFALNSEASKNASKALIRSLARTQGIQLGYVDMDGRRQEASVETLLAILDLFGISARTDQESRHALRQNTLSQWNAIVSPIVVVWDGQNGVAQLRLPERASSKKLECRLRLETGETRQLKFSGARVHRRRTVDTNVFVARELRLPKLPWGYHRLEVEFAGGLSRSLIISSPTRAYSKPDARKQWGVFLPVHAACSKSSWGAGNISDIKRLGRWVGESGGSLVATLPLLGSFLGSPVCEPSPYSPATRLCWNEFYLDVEAAAEFATSTQAKKLVQSRAFRRRLDAFRHAPIVDYKAQMALRREVLELLAKKFFNSSACRSMGYRQFLRQQAFLDNYAAFRAVCDESRQPWHNWPARLRDGVLRSGDYSEDSRNYHLYVQWLASRQFSALRSDSESCDDASTPAVQYYLDLPLGVHPDGYDIWRFRDAFAFPARAGAPPDTFFTRGQDWGFAPLHPQRIRSSGYSYLLDLLRFQMRHTGMLRIDHAMGLHRLFWIPPGFVAAQGAYVSYPAEELYALLCLESHRHETVLVGENLGTVPPGVNRAMARHALRQMFVLQYEQKLDRKTTLRKPPVHSVASLNTHDLPQFAAHLRGCDIDDRFRLGLIPRNRLSLEHRGRRKLISALEFFLQLQGWLKQSPQKNSRKHNSREKRLLHACLAWLFTSRTETVLVNLEDLWLETRPQNVPGTHLERPNWRRRARYTIEEIEQSRELRDVLQTLNSLRQRSTCSPS